MGPPRIFGGLILNCLWFAGNECLSFAPSGLGLFCFPTHGLRRGLHSFAASRLRVGGRECITHESRWNHTERLLRGVSELSER